MLAADADTPADVLRLRPDVPGPVRHRHGQVVSPQIMRRLGPVRHPGLVLAAIRLPVMVEKTSTRWTSVSTARVYTDTSALLHDQGGHGSEPAW